MAIKPGKEFLDDARKEHTRQHNGAKKLKAETAAPAPEPEAPKQEAGTPSPETEQPKQESAGSSATPPPTPQPESVPDPEKEAFKQKFDEFFKGNPMISGKVGVELVDDLKANLLMVYAHSKGVTTITKEMLKMDGNAKELCAFLVDYAIKNKIFGFFEKYPLAGALVVMLISAGGSFLMVQMLANTQTEAQKQKDKNHKLQAEIEALKKKGQEKRRTEATTVEPEKETVNNSAPEQEPEQAQEPEPEAEVFDITGNDTRELISSV